LIRLPALIGVLLESQIEKGETMKPLLRGQQKASLMGKMSFILGVRAELTDAERGNTAKYRLGNIVLYSREHIADPGSGLLGLASRLAFKAMNISVANGKHIECKDIQSQRLRLAPY
jgi:hypothetical protein